ncbi:TPA: hypothetical protein ACPXRF_000162 [Klebsiella pneumoniae]
MATVDDVAQWMKSELENTNWLYQETVVYKIKELLVRWHAAGSRATGVSRPDERKTMPLR